MANMNTFKLVGGLDIGNGYTKGKFVVNDDKSSPILVDMPSCVSYISSQRWMPVEPDDGYVDALVNELDCTISSEAIAGPDRGRVLFGKRAVDSGQTPVIFNIDDHVPKCDDSLSVELILGTLAALAIRTYWKRNHKLPTKTLDVTSVIGLALPIADFVGYRERYRQILMSSDHKVYVHNFADDIVVAIHFDEVAVLAEGAAAQYAISDLGAPFLDAAIAQCRKAGVPIDDSETGASLISYTNTIGVDVGEGTVNFPVFRNGKVSVESSSSINKGYGTVLANVVEQVRNLSFAPQSRKDLGEFMLKENPNAQQKKLQARLKLYIDEETSVFARDVIMEYKAVLAKVKLNVDVVYVYGGGANSVRPILWPALVEASKLDEGVYTPVVYLDSAYSRDLNRNGLFMVARITDKARSDKAGVHTLS